MDNMSLLAIRHLCCKPWLGGSPRQAFDTAAGQPILLSLADCVDDAANAAAIRVPECRSARMA